MSAGRKIAVVTGGAGFIGSHMVDLLVERGYRVRVIDNLVGGREATSPSTRDNPDVVFEASDIRAYRARHTRCSRAPTMCFILPASATSCPRSSGRSNTCRSTCRAPCTCSNARAQAGAEKFVYAASSSCYGACRHADARGPPDRAAISLCAEQVSGRAGGLALAARSIGCRSIRSASSMPTARVRAPPAPMARCSACSCGRSSPASRSPWSATARKRRDFLYVTDVADAFLARGRDADVRRDLEFGAGNPQSVNRLVELLGGAVVHIPKRPGEPDCTWADIGKITRDLGWAPKVSFEEGVAAHRSTTSITGATRRSGTPDSIAQGDDRLVSTLTIGIGTARPRRSDGRRKHAASSATRSRRRRRSPRPIGPRPREKKVIMCHGTFDIVHPGHVRHLLYAKSKADILVASLTADAHITKANFRPFVPQELARHQSGGARSASTTSHRRRSDAAQEHRDHPARLFRQGLRIHQRAACIPRTAEEQAVIEAYGGEIIFTPGDIVYSSSHIIETEPPAIATEKLMALLDAEKPQLRRSAAQPSTSSTASRCTWSATRSSTAIPIAR